MVAIWHKNERLKKMVLEEVITRSPVDQFQIQGQFWNPWEKIFDWYFIHHHRVIHVAVIWRKNERLKKWCLTKSYLLKKIQTDSHLCFVPQQYGYLRKAWLKNIGIHVLGNRTEPWRLVKHTISTRNDQIWLLTKNLIEKSTE